MERHEKSGVDARRAVFFQRTHATLPFLPFHSPVTQEHVRTFSLGSFSVFTRHCIWKASLVLLHLSILTQKTSVLTLLVIGYASVSPVCSWSLGSYSPTQFWQHQTPEAGVQSPSMSLLLFLEPQVPHSCPTWLQVRASHDPLLGLSCWSCSQTLGTKHSAVTSL